MRDRGGDPRVRTELNGSDRAVRRRSISIPCGRWTAASLAAATRGYVDAAYPRGGSACAQAARTTLLDTARLCEAHQAGELKLRRSQLALLRTVVRWYFSADGPGNVESGAQLDRLLAAHNKNAS